MKSTTVKLTDAEEECPMIATQYYIRHGGKTFTVSSIQDAAEKWDAFRKASLAGCSEIGNGVEVVDHSGKKVARISYNGRVWTEGSRYF